MTQHSHPRRNPTYRILVRRIGRDHLDRIYPEIIMRGTSGGKSVRRLISLNDLNSGDAGGTGLFDAAAEAGIPLILKGRRDEFLQAIEQKLNLANGLSARSDFDVATRVGWFGNGFVTPFDIYIYDDRSRDLVSALKGIDRPERWGRSGERSDWKRMAKWAGDGNPLLIFAVCAALAPPLLLLLGMDGFGLMLVGSTSIGKSTVSRFASSVWGGDPSHPRGFMDSLYSTTNNLERIATQSRDCFIVFDDTKHIPGGIATKNGAATLAQAILIMVGGVAKGRLTDDSPADWRVVFWMTSNDTTQKILSDGGIEYDDAYAVRLNEISAERRYGVFDRIPPGMSAAFFAEEIWDRSNKIYGSAGHAYLQRLVEWRKRDERKLVAWLKGKSALFRMRCGIDGSSEIEARTSKNFGAVYAAGLLGYKAGVVPWPPEVIEAAILEVYQDHLRVIRANSDKRDYLGAVRAYLAAHEHQFVDVSRRVPDLTGRELADALGFITRSKQAPREFSFLPEMFPWRNGRHGEMNVVIAALKRGNFLIHDQGNSGSTRKNQTKRQLRQPRPDDDGRRRVYCINAAILDGLEETRSWRLIQGADSRPLDDTFRKLRSVK